MTEFMTVQQLSSYLGVNKRTIYRLLQRGDIPATRIGHIWRFNKASIDEWIRRGSVGVKASILVIDDDKIIRKLFKRVLEELGHEVVDSETSFEGLELVKQRNFDLIFIDLKMPGMDGATLFREIRNIKPEIPVIIITGYPDSEIMKRALAQGPFGLMNKPFGESDIITSLNSFLQIGKSREKRSLLRGTGSKKR